MLSVIIPHRSDGYLNQTINDLLQKSEGELEVIVVCDGVWPSEIITDKRVKYIHHGTQHNNDGMRSSINKGVAISKGEFIMKTDEHTMFDKGFDLKLAQDCEDDWVVIPRRYRLEPDKWEIIEDGRKPIDYMHIDYPYQRPLDKTCGLHGAEWKARISEALIDDTPTMQGSCYFMKRSYWDKLFLDGLDDKNYGTFTAEAQEISMAVWLSGGSVKVNKKTWYAHMHKGSKGKSYNFTTEQYKKHCADMEKGRVYCINKWLYTKDYKHNWEWFINKFPDMPGWGTDWKERIEKDKEFDYSSTKYKDDFWLSNLRV